MYLHLYLIALVAAPLAFSLPQPLPEGDLSALAARHGPANSTAGGEGEHHSENHLGPSRTHHPERALVEGRDAGNSTGGSNGHHREGKKHDGEHSASHRPSRDLTERQDSSNVTRSGGEHLHAEHDLKGKKHHGSPSYSSRDLSERHDSPGNSTSSTEHHESDKYHQTSHLEERIEERNGTAGGYTGSKKYRPESFQRKGNATSHYEKAMKSKQEWKKIHLEYEQRLNSSRPATAL